MLPAIGLLLAYGEVDVSFYDTMRTSFASQKMYCTACKMLTFSKPYSSNNSMSVQLFGRKATDCGKERWENQKREGKLGFLLSFARCTRDSASLRRWKRHIKNGHSKSNIPTVEIKMIKNKRKVLTKRFTCRILIKSLRENDGAKRKVWKQTKKVVDKPRFAWYTK